MFKFRSKSYTPPPQDPDDVFQTTATVRNKQGSKHIPGKGQLETSALLEAAPLSPTVQSTEAQVYKGDNIHVGQF
jgi:hypothetical protein